jgi:hypothetical protein
VYVIGWLLEELFESQAAIVKPDKLPEEDYGRIFTIKN